MRILISLLAGALVLPLTVQAAPAAGVQGKREEVCKPGQACPPRPAPAPKPKAMAPAKAAKATDGSQFGSAERRALLAKRSAKTSPGKPAALKKPKGRS
jgi:hypothetical protein